MADSAAWIQDMIGKVPSVQDLDPAILKLAQTDLTYIDRFLAIRNTKEASLALLIQCLKWRKQFGTSQISRDSVSKSSVGDSKLFSIGDHSDFDGNPLAVLRMNNFRAIKAGGLFEDAARLVVAELESHFKANMSGRGEVTLVVDLRGCGTNEIDFEFCRFLRDCFDCYYPGGLGRLVLAAMPWSLTTQWALVKTLIPTKFLKLVHVARWSELSEFVTQSFLNDDGVSSSQQTRSALKVESIDADNDNPRRRVTFSHVGLGPGERPQNLIAKVTPAKEIVFVLSEEGILRSFLKVDNEVDRWIMYKIKTTSPESYRVKPNIGAIAPGESISIDLSRRNSDSRNEPFRDKFLVMTADFPEIEPGAFPPGSPLADRKQEVASTMFKRLPKSQITEFKLHTNYTGNEAQNDANSALLSGADGSFISPTKSPLPDRPQRLQERAAAKMTPVSPTQSPMRQKVLENSGRSGHDKVMNPLLALLVGVFLGLLIEELLNIGLGHLIGLV